MERKAKWQTERDCRVGYDTVIYWFWNRWCCINQRAKDELLNEKVTPQFSAIITVRPKCEDFCPNKHNWKGLLLGSHWGIMCLAALAALSGVLRCLTWCVLCPNSVTVSGHKKQMAGDTRQWQNECQASLLSLQLHCQQAKKAAYMPLKTHCWVKTSFKTHFGRFLVFPSTKGLGTPLWVEKVSSVGFWKQLEKETPLWPS